MKIETQETLNVKTGHSPLSRFVQSVHPPINDEVLSYIDDHCFHQNVSKGALLFKRGEICHQLYFVKQGVLRAYLKDGRREITTWITAENEIVTSIRGFHLQQPLLEDIQAIENCELIGAGYEDLQHLYDHFPDMNIVGRKLLEQYYIDAEERAYIGRLSKASSKYQHFIATKGPLANRIPLKYIASYLGITIETLSRIRSKMMQGNNSRKV